MARIRTVKPEFYTSEDLQDLERDHPELKPMLVFSGLWGHCDRFGRFEWKPRTLKLGILPFIEYDLGASLVLLWEAGQIQKYEIGGKTYGFIPTFSEHQRINGKEAQAPGKYPEPLEFVDLNKSGSNREVSEKRPGAQEGKGREGKGTKEVAPASADAPDGSTGEASENASGIGSQVHVEHSEPTGDGKTIAQADLDLDAPPAQTPPAEKEAKKESKSSATFEAYAAAYREKYRTEPLRGASVNSMLCRLVDIVGAEAAPHVAQFYVRHTSAFYKTRSHPVELLLQDVQKLHTEWRTGCQVTAAQARQEERTSSNAAARIAVELRQQENSHA